MEFLFNDTLTKTIKSLLLAVIPLQFLLTTAKGVPLENGFNRIIKSVTPRSN